eukprot:5475233-Prymnesium_polylepis.1
MSVGSCSWSTCNASPDQLAERAGLVQASRIHRVAHSPRPQGAGCRSVSQDATAVHPRYALWHGREGCDMRYVMYAHGEVTVRTETRAFSQPRPAMAADAAVLVALR